MFTFTAMPRKSGACMDHSHERMSFQTHITQVEKRESHIYSDVLGKGSCPSCQPLCPQYLSHGR